MKTNYLTKELRRFNRYYNRKLRMLNEPFAQSDLTLTQIHILFELSENQEMVAKALSEKLFIDQAQLSRVLQKLEAKSCIKCILSTNDKRKKILRLTDKGKKKLLALESTMNQNIAQLIEPLTKEERELLLRSVKTIQALFEGNDNETLLIRPIRMRDVGTIIQRHSVLYSQEFGWDQSFEVAVIDAMHEFSKNSKQTDQIAWVAEVGDEFAGCVFLFKETNEVARLRCLLVEPRFRGKGIGALLIKQCIKSSEEQGYRKMRLWTCEQLVQARRLYQKAGLHCIKSEVEFNFGQKMLGETWEIVL